MTIERLAQRGVTTLPVLQEVPNDWPGPRTIGVYMVSKRGSYVVVAQLSPKFTARLVDRWQELENRPLTRLQALTLAPESEKRAIAGEQQIEIMRPHVETLRRLASAEFSADLLDAYGRLPPALMLPKPAGIDR